MTVEFPVPENMRLVWTDPVSYSNPINFPQIDAGSLAAPGTGLSVFCERPRLQRNFLRYAPEFVDDPAGGKIFTNLGAAVYTSPPAFVAAADNAALVGYRTLIAEGRFFNDHSLDSPMQVEKYLSRLGQSEPFANEDTKLGRQADTDTFILKQSGQRWRRFDQPVIVLCSHEPSNYGSFLFRVLPKLCAVLQLGLTEFPVICWNIQSATIGLLETAGVKPEHFIPHDTNAITVLDRAIFPSLHNPHGLLDHESRDLYRELRIRHGAPPGRDRLYISRLSYGKKAGAVRVMANEAELITRLIAIGFSVVSPEELTPRQQIEAFSSAEIIVGPAGSGMFNTVFCRPGTKVIDIESEEHWIYTHSGFFASCELRYGIFVGKVDESDPSPVHRRWSVDIEALMDRVGRFLHS